MSEWRYNDATWKKVRKSVLIRDSHRCQLRLRKCTKVATEVHHKVSAKDRPDLRYMPSNLVASCRWCNRHLGGKEAARRNRERRRRYPKYPREW